MQQTSINTDNPGVNRISIENEYTLLYKALQKRVDDQGTRLHSDEELQSWLRHLILQSKLQSLHTDKG